MGLITDKLSFNAAANYYKYNLSLYDYAWNKPDWDAKLALKYNLRDKIIAGMDLTAQGKCQMLVNGIIESLIFRISRIFLIQLSNLYILI